MKKIKENKKIIIIVISAIVLVIGLVIGGINIANSKDYKEIKNQYQEVLGENVNLGLVHRKDEIDQAYTNFTLKVEEYQKEIDTKVKALSFDVKAFVKTNKVDVPSTLSKQIELLNTAGLVDNVKSINTYDNYKPAKSNDAIKKEVKDIDTKAAEAYDLIVKEISTKFKVTKDEVTKFLKDLDFKKALTEAQMKTLKTLATVDFSDEFIKQIETIKNDIKKIVDNIKKEVKTIQDKEKKEAEAAKAKAQAGGSGAVSSGKYTGGGSTSNTSSMNDWCKKTYGSQGWTQWYSSSNLCGYPEGKKPVVTKPAATNPGAIKYMTPAQAKSAIESAMLQVIRDYGAYMGVTANPTIWQPLENQPDMANVFPQYAGDSTPQYIAQGMFDAYLREELRGDPNAVPRGTFYINIYVTNDYQVSAGISADFS